ncbi:LysM peptidoglycan-binding domain-containing protein [Knoellia aerolata]|uniref:LysM domain-containing protein n=1 Tax=Knoellia aerolata DSM 18566 TaxID=1385519 RepID=A0A0A0JWR4_9MICO|nr:LysM peptidoglycan-binding domain-containing protein [Knoellia aerolata]KGN41895.1 hypothetical protein N801_04215 [Knoellia aerolata DSM 18566]
MAALIILGIVIGLPVALLAIGANPLPDEVPTLEQLRVFLTSPDDGTLALGFITLVGWAAWASLAASLAMEGIARVRRTSPPHLPGLALPQSAARGLIGAALLLFVTAPVGMPTAHGSVGTAATASAAVSTPSIAAPVPSGQLAPSATPQAQVVPPEAKPSTIEHTVKRGDTLWSLAEAHLGDGARYGEIVELNPKTLGDDPGFLTPGTALTIPTPHTKAAGADDTRVVELGDTLSEIAKDELGDPDRYPEIYAASKDTAQPGDRRLVDPDLILPGWTLTIPGAATPATSPTAPTSKAPAESVAPPPASTAPHSVPSGETPGAETTNPPAASTPSIPSGQSVPAPASTGAVEETSSVAPWMLTGLVGGGGVLAGSMALLLLRRRRAQFRARRPGRTIATPKPVLIPVEKTVTAIGSTTAPTVEHLDAALRRLALSHTSAGQAMPEVAAVQMTQTGLTLHLSGPSTLDAPWQGTEDHLHWTLSAQADPATVEPPVEEQPAPYPMLCTIGASDAGDVWMLNLEDMDLVITGDADYGRDFARYIAAEIACNPWSHGVKVDLIGVATEVAAMNPERMRVHTGDDPATDLVADAVAMIDRSQDAGTDVSSARAAQLGADPWPARMLMVDTAADTTPALEQLLDLVRTHGGHTGTSVVVRGEDLASDGIEVQISTSGRIVMPTSGLNLIAVGLTADEAQGCAALLAQSEDLEDVDIPSVDADEESWKAWTDEAGALRDEYTLPRSSHDDEDEWADPNGEAAQGAASPTSILTDPDEEYVEHGATTIADLNALAPRVTPQVRDAVLNADPTLDDDLERWHSDACDLPRLTFLGPVTARTRGAALAKRKPYFTELLAYLVTRRHGATPDEVADTFNISQTKARDYVNTVRDWLGTNPRTGDKHLPDARKAPLAQTRGTSVYQVLDALVDADLFRRLRARGEARGAEGIDDLCAALRLVQGRPFESLRKGGWYWLSEGDRLDQHMVCAVVDVAHLVTTHSLRKGDLKRARLAAETAALAAPDEEIPRLDLAAVAAAEGHPNEAGRILRDEILNRTDDDGPPAELSERTQQIIAGRDWQKHSQQAS